MSKQYVWIYEISMYSVFRLILLTPALAGNDLIIKYFDANDRAESLLRGWLQLLSAFTTQIHIDESAYSEERFTAENPESDPFAARYSADAELHELCVGITNGLIQTETLPNRLTSQYDTERFRLYFRRLLSSEYERIFRRIHLLRALHSTGDMVYFIPPIKKFDDKIYTHRTSSDIVVLPSSILSFGKRYLSIAADIHGVLHKARNKISVPSMGSASRTKPMDTAESSNFVVETKSSNRLRVGKELKYNLDANDRNEMSWYFESDLGPEQTSVIIGDLESYSSSHITNVKSKGELTEKLSDLSLHWVELSSWRPNINGSFAYEVLLSSWLIGELCVKSVVNAHRIPFPVWRSWSITTYQMRVVKWKSFFAEYNMNVVLHHFKTPDAIPISSAMKQLDGISIFTQYSTNHGRTAIGAEWPASDVNFIYGKTYSSDLDTLAINNRIDIVSGQYLSDLSDKNKAEAAETREELNQQCNYILGVFDNSYQENYIHLTPTIMRRFYDTLLDLAMSCEDIGLVIKPKHGLETLKDLGNVYEKIKKLENQGRCVVLDHRKPAVSAALCADLTVGIGLNSAVFEGLRVGTPGVHFDLVGMQDSVSYYEEGLGRFIFRDGEALCSAIQAAKNNPEETDIGNHGELIDKDDPFRDDKSGYRIGEFIRWFLEAREQGDNREEALNQACEAYSEEVGSEYVLRYDSRGEGHS